MVSDKQIQHNIAAHDRVSRRYDAIHGDIFNPVEQDRLHAKLAQAAGMIVGPSSEATALDYGCGTGNLTRHLLELGLKVVAADVSGESLRLLEERFGPTGRVRTVRFDGGALTTVPDGSVEMAAAYSVLHHVPDYLQAVRDMVRMVRPGGVIYIDHERSESFWRPAAEYQQYLRLARPFWLRLTGPEGWKKFVRPSNYIMKLRRLKDRRYTVEGDIHVWPDDHIEWDQVTRTLEQSGCRILAKDEYLPYQRGFRPDVYQRYKDRIADMCVLIARKA